MVRLDELDRLEKVQELLGKVLAEGTFRLIRRGIDRGYRDVREDLSGIRGKIADATPGPAFGRAYRSTERLHEARQRNFGELHT